MDEPTDRMCDKAASTITSFTVFLGQRNFNKVALSHIQSVGSSMMTALEVSVIDLLLVIPKIVLL